MSQTRDPGGSPVAIIGIGCRFPGGVTDVENFWKLLSEGSDAITEIPTSRIDLDRFFEEGPVAPGKMTSRYGGFLDGIDEFDAEFFKISPREAERLDPQQRLMLETAWEALEDAGQDVNRLQGAKIGVFVGQWASDFETRVFAHPDAVDFYTAHGSGRYATSGRNLLCVWLSRAQSHHRQRLFVIARCCTPCGAEPSGRRERLVPCGRSEHHPAAADHHCLFTKRHDG